MTRILRQGLKVIDTSGPGWKGTVISQLGVRNRNFTRVRWDNGEVRECPTVYLKVREGGKRNEETF